MKGLFIYRHGATLMRLLCGWLVMTTVTAGAAFGSLHVIANTGNTLSAKPYYDSAGLDASLSAGIKALNEAAIHEKAAMNNATIKIPKGFAEGGFAPSKAQISKVGLSSGLVRKHRLKSHAFNMTPVFVIGNDKASLTWLKQNASYLKKIHALGLLANDFKPEALKQLKADTGLALLYANLNGLSTVVRTSHYPFLIYKGWVLQ